MSLQEIKVFLKQTLSSKIDAVELTSLIGMLIEAVTGWNRMQQIVNVNQQHSLIRIMTSKLIQNTKCN